MSPETITQGKLDVMVSRGVTRASIGVQSFLAEETRAVRRPQDPADVARALEMIRASDIEVFNLDLIYGMPGQTPRHLGALAPKRRCATSPRRSFCTHCTCAR